MSPCGYVFLYYTFCTLFQFVPVAVLRFFCRRYKVTFLGGGVVGGMAAMASFAAAVAVGRLGKRVVGLGARAVTVERVGRQVVAVRAEAASLVELEGRVKHWAIRTAKDAASQSALMTWASLLTFNAVMTLPALAEEVEREPKGKLFDFNLTLPIIAVQFLLLMVALDNIWFKPVAKVMDARDENVRAKLMGVRDNSGEIKRMQDEAEAILRAARIETTQALSKTKKLTAAMLDAKLQKSRNRIEEELAQALTNLEEQKQDTLRSLDTHVQSLSEEILSKVFPFKL